MKLLLTDAENFRIKSLNDQSSILIDYGYYIWLDGILMSQMRPK